MDFRGEAEFPSGSAGPAVPDLPSPGHGFQMWNPSVGDQAIWATEDEYRSWNASPPSEIQSNLNQKVGGGIASRLGTEPPNKKLRNNSQSVDSISNRSKGIGKMFFKTKLCCKFRAGVCPYITNCNFAHGIEELRRPPPNWQEIVAAAHEGEGDISASEQREEHQIPTISPSELRGDHTQRSHKGRHCKKFYTEEGCPYGDNCTFLHDEQSRSRESVAISVSPTVGGSISGLNQKPSNWKTRICNKWETTGNCPFGSKCHFAHGLAELHRYGGGLIDTESQDSSLPTESKLSMVVAAKTTEAVPPPPPSSAPSHHTGLGAPSQLRFSSVMIQQPLPSAPVQRPLQRSKGPDKISKIYGDWIDDIE